MSEIEVLEPGLRRIVAPNASPMTGPGTNTYLLGERRVAVIDPGPDTDAHLDAILSAVGPGEISHILVTHAHLDHSALAPRLGRIMGAPVLAFGPPGVGRSATMASLGLGLDDRAGVDIGFVPDRKIADGEVLSDEEWDLTALWTPGHFGSHLSFAWRSVIFTGDLVMGWSSTIISPPEGDLGDYLASCARLRATAPRRLFPGHGAPVEAPVVRIEDLVRHRHARTDQIRAALAAGPSDAQTLAQHLYPDLPEDYRAAAARTVLAHLIHLLSEGVVETSGAPHPRRRFALL